MPDTLKAPPPSTVSGGAEGHRGRLGKPGFMASRDSHPSFQQLHLLSRI